MRRREDKAEEKYEERWSQIESKLKEYRELISSISKPSSSKPSGPPRAGSLARLAKAPSVNRAPSLTLSRDRSKEPTSRARGTSIARKKSPAAKPQPTLSVSGISCMRSRNGLSSSRSSVSSARSSSSIPKLQTLRPPKVSIGQITQHMPQPATRSSIECQATPEVHPPLCSLSPLVVHEDSKQQEAYEGQIELINLELRQLLLSPYSYFVRFFFPR